MSFLLLYSRNTKHVSCDAVFQRRFTLLQKPPTIISCDATGALGLYVSDIRCNLPDTTLATRHEVLPIPARVGWGPDTSIDRLSCMLATVATSFYPPMYLREVLRSSCLRKICVYCCCSEAVVVFRLVKQNRFPRSSGTSGRLCFVATSRDGPPCACCFISSTAATAPLGRTTPS